MLIAAAIFGILGWLFTWLVLPWVARQEKQRKDNRRERRKRLMKLGKEFDSQVDENQG